jgi:hypothetical protein
VGDSLGLLLPLLLHHRLLPVFLLFFFFSRFSSIFNTRHAKSIVTLTKSGQGRGKKKQ